MLAIRGATFARAGGFSIRVDDFAVRPGEVVAILAPSGAGKSTLFEGLLGFGGVGVATTGHGGIELAGAGWPRSRIEQRRRALREAVSFLPQDPVAAFDPVRRLRDQLRATTGALPAAQAAALRSLDEADPAAVLAAVPSKISGGQAQRVLFALAALRRAPLLLVDEPTAGLDAARADAVAEVLTRLCSGATPAAACIATHDAAFVARVGARPWTIVDGRLVAGRPEQPPWPRRSRRTIGEVVLAGADLQVGPRRRPRLVVPRFELRAGETCALLGPSGVGKTTLARVLAGHLPCRGRIVRPARRSAVQLLFQDAAGSLTPHRTVRSLVEEVMTAVRDTGRAFDLAAIADQLGLTDALLDRPAFELSGGERRRAALLRALAAQPSVLLLDEPTASLDRTSAIRVVETLEDVCRRTGVAMLWITHDDELAAAVADRTVRIGPGGRLIEP